MYILKNNETLPVKNIEFKEINNFQILTRFIDETRFEVGLFKNNEFNDGWNNDIIVYYYEKENPDITFKINFGTAKIASKIMIVTSEFKLVKKKLNELSEKQYKKHSIIPRVIIQTHKTYYFKKREYYDASRSWILKNPGYSYIFYDDHDCHMFINKFFPPYVEKAWLSLIPGAFKADLFRYCILYFMGGIYVDFDTICVQNIDSIIDYNTVCMAAREPKNYTKLWNAFIAVSKKNPIMELSIGLSVRNILYKINPKSVLDVTGPGVFGYAINKICNRTRHMNHPLGTFPLRNFNIKICQNNHKGWNVTQNNKVIMVSKWLGYNSSTYSNRIWYK